MKAFIRGVTKSQWFAMLASMRLAPLGTTGLSVSPVGFGTYRVDDVTSHHAEALKKALKLGCNLIDTSTNYTDGGSERCIGGVLKELFETKEISREKLIVVSKVGYVQGGNLKLAHQRENEGKPFQDMVKFMDGCWHCIHPDFIQEQLENSLERLQLKTLDVYLLHNPEYFLSDASHRTPPSDLREARNLFYDRIARAFEFLEKASDDGKIRYYGVSSNTFGALTNDYEGTSLTRMLELAEKLGGHNHRFRVVQFPMNLFETNPFFHHNNGPGETKTLLEWCQEKNLGVLINRPLNAFYKGNLIRLAAIRGYPQWEKTVQEIEQSIHPHLPEAWKNASLSQKSIAALMNAKGVSSVLVGMRRPKFVDDTMGALDLLSAEIGEAMYSVFR